MTLPPVPDQKSLVGYTIGKCKLLRICGRGAMGTVYKGIHQGLDIEVAVKILPPHLALNANLVERFLREAKLAARLNHANAVRVYDVGEEAGYYYLVMEYIDGTDALELLHRHGRQPASVVADIGSGAARAIEEAHKSDVIHRDIKPANLMLPNSGGVKVADFGLARALASESGLTMSGAIMGTPDYMAPEQAQGAQVGPLADVYSLGATLYHLFVGRPPFHGATPMAVALQHVTSRIIVPENLVRDDVDRMLVRMINELTQKDPLRRPHDLSVVSGQLLEIARTNRRTKKLLSEGATLYATVGLKLDVAAINREKAEEAVAAMDKGRVESPHLDRLRKAAEKARGNTKAVRADTGTRERRPPTDPAELAASMGEAASTSARRSSGQLPALPPTAGDDTTSRRAPSSPAHTPHRDTRPSGPLRSTNIVQSPERDPDGWQSYAARSFPTFERKSIMDGSARGEVTKSQSSIEAPDSQSSSITDFPPVAAAPTRRYQPRRGPGPGVGLLIALALIAAVAFNGWYFFLQGEDGARIPVGPGTTTPLVVRFSGVARGTVGAVAAHGDGRRFFSGSDDGEVFAWALGGELPEYTQRLGNSITAIALRSDGGSLVVGTSRGEVIELDSRDLSIKSHRIASLDGAAVSALQFPSPGLIVVGDTRGRIRTAGGDAPVRVDSAGRPVRGLLWHGGELWAAAGTTIARYAITADGLQLKQAHGSLPAPVEMLAMAEGQVYAAVGTTLQRVTTEGPEGPVYEAEHPFIAAAPGGGRLVAANRDGVVLLSLQTMAQVDSIAIDRFGTPVTAASADRGRLIIGTRGGEIILLLPR